MSGANPYAYESALWDMTPPENRLPYPPDSRILPHLTQVLQTLALAPTPIQIRENWPIFCAQKRALEAAKFRDREGVNPSDEPYDWKITFEEALEDNGGEEWLSEFMEWWIDHMVGFYTIWVHRTGANALRAHEALESLNLREQQERKRLDELRAKRKKEAEDDLI